MRHGLALALMLAAGAFGCDAGGAPERPRETVREAPKAVAAPEAQGKKLYGAPIATANEEKLGDVLREPERFAGTEVVLSGHVRRACTRMGCWMELASGDDPRTPACRVNFHGAGFFIPKDSAGSEARVQGRIEVVSVTPERARHLEEEGARFADKGEDGSAREVHLTASGVELFRRGG